MLHDLHENGISADGWDFDRVVKNNWFEHKYENGENLYKLNPGGIARLNRLTAKLEAEKPSQPPSIFIHHNQGAVNTGQIGGDQIGGEQNVSSQQPLTESKKSLWQRIIKWWTEHFFMRLIVTVIGAWLAFLLLKHFYNRA